jgi:phosphoadenosine phosphosulfate reductase
MASPPLTEKELSAAQEQLESATASEILAWIEGRFGADAVLACSFGVEDIVLIDLASRHAPSLRLFTLDTGRLPQQTYEVMEVVRKRYGLTIETFAPEGAAVEALTTAKGQFSFRESLENRHECCRIRKVEPLARALQGRSAWVTGLRREQSPTRTGAEVLELDRANGGIAKLNPLAAWTQQEVWAYVAQGHLPYNVLHDLGYPSIGCAPCTRAIRPYEDARAGRWWWEQPENKECGLHERK